MDPEIKARLLERAKSLKVGQLIQLSKSEQAAAQQYLPSGINIPRRVTENNIEPIRNFVSQQMQGPAQPPASGNNTPKYSISNTQPLVEPGTRQFNPQQIPPSNWEYATGNKWGDVLRYTQPLVAPSSSQARPINYNNVPPGQAVNTSEGYAIRAGNGVYPNAMQGFKYVGQSPNWHYFAPEMGTVNNSSRNTNPRNTGL